MPLVIFTIFLDKECLLTYFAYKFNTEGNIIILQNGLALKTSPVRGEQYFILNNVLMDHELFPIHVSHIAAFQRSRTGRVARTPLSSCSWRQKCSSIGNIGLQNCKTNIQIFHHLKKSRLLAPTLEDSRTEWRHCSGEKLFVFTPIELNEMKWAECRI